MAPSLTAVAESQKQAAAKPAETAPVVGRRKDRSHTTIYLDPRVLKEIRRVALDYDRKPHDLLIEGVNMMLAHYGRPSVADITRGDDAATS
jgi:hypothetical protein